MPLSAVSLQALRRLRAYVPPATVYGSLPLSRRAAVLILLFADARGELRVVLTMRAQTLKSFPGQVAFPGGRADSLSESAFETARREAFEEIGLPSDDRDLFAPFRVEHLCEMPSHLARTEVAVRPCVAFLHSDGGGEAAMADVEKSLIPRLDAKEVAAVFTAPFHNFLRVEDEGSSAIVPDPAADDSAWYEGSFTTWHGRRFPMHNFFVPVAGHPVATARNPDGHGSAAERSHPRGRFRVWGMTARIMVDAARLAYDETPEFEHVYHAGDEDVIERLWRAGRLEEIHHGPPVTAVQDEAGKGSKM